MLVNITNTGQVNNHYNGRCLEEKNIAIMTSLSGSSLLGLPCEQRNKYCNLRVQQFLLFHISFFQYLCFSTHSSL